MHKLLMWALLTRAKSTARTTTEGASLLTRFPPLMIHWKYLVSTTWACRSRSCHWCSGKYTPQHNYCSLKKTYCFSLHPNGQNSGNFRQMAKTDFRKLKSLGSCRDNHSLPHTALAAWGGSEPHVQSSHSVGSRSVGCMMEPRKDKVVKLFKRSEVTGIMHKADSSAWIILHNVFIIIIRSFKHPPSCTTSPGKCIPG